MTPERVLQKEKPQELTPAFDVSSYWGLEEKKIIKRVKEDLKSYSFEQGELPDREKTTHFTWLVKNGEVVHPDPEIGPVIDYIKDRTPREKQEKDAFLKIREFLIEEEPGSIVCWFSPKTSEDEQEGYTEGRVVVYSIEEKKGVKTVELYEFGSRHYSFGQQLRIANQFRGYSQEEYYFPNLDKLRETPILLEEVKLRQVVEEVATYPEAWEDIVQGKVRARMEKFEQEVAIPVASFSNRAILQMMGVQSFEGYRNHYSLMLEISGNKATVLNFKKEKKYHGKCPICGYVIAKEKAISAGERCPGCGNIYEGC